MSETEKPQSEWARKRAAGKARRARLVERRETYFDLLMSGYSVQQIAKAMDRSVSAVRRAIDQALAERRLDAPEDYARLQIARLNKALRCADALLEQGEVTAIPHFVKVVAELDRYHGFSLPMRPRLARLLPNPRRSEAPPAPPALTHAPALAMPIETVAAESAGGDS